MCKRLGGQMLAAAKANFEPERGGPVWKLARGIGNGLRRIKGKTRQSRAQKQGLMSAQLLAPPPAVQPRGIHLAFPLGFYTSVQQLRVQLPVLASGMGFAAHVPQRSG
jgi:hypothetical protein